MTYSEMHYEVPFTANDHDVRLERGTWVYWVRGVRSVESLRADAMTGGVAEAIVGALINGLLAFWWRRRGRVWKVGVIRVRGSRFGPQGRFELVHHEKLPPGAEPAPRIAELVAEIESGRFDEPQSRS